MRVYREGRYDRSKGRLSSWILSIAHHTALRIARSSRKNLLPGATILNDTPDEQSLRTIWTDERDRTILSRAISILREESDVDDRTLQAFELVALRGVPAPEAATQAGMTVDQVYVAKSRMTKRLREVVAQLTEAFEEDV